MHTTMKSLSQRNPVLIGVIGAALTAAIVLGALQYKKLPFFDRGKEYSAYFAEASGLRSGAAVQVSGFRVGEVTGIRLDVPRVLVDFKVTGDIRLGDRSEAEINTKGLPGREDPRGDPAWRRAVVGHHPDRSHQIRLPVARCAG